MPEPTPSRPACRRLAPTLRWCTPAPALTLALAAALVPAAAGAASVTVDFRPAEGEEADYDEVRILLLPQVNGGTATGFETEEKSFSKTFEDLAPGRHTIMTSTFPFPGLVDLEKHPAPFVYVFMANLPGPSSTQTVKVRYRRADLGSVRGSVSATGSVRRATGEPVGGLDLVLAARVKGAGTVIAGRARTGADGGFEVGGLHPEVTYRVVRAEDEQALGEVTPGTAAEIALAPVPGDPAPDVAFTDLEKGDAQVRLSDLRGKIVVVEYWASWCAPCQTAMAELQETVADRCKDWADVVVLAASVDDKRETGAAHATKKGWDKARGIRNVWVGPGAFRAPAAQAFGLDGIPSSVLIDPAGKIVTIAHPGSYDLVEAVGRVRAAAAVR